MSITSTGDTTKYMCGTERSFCFRALYYCWTSDTRTPLPLYRLFVPLQFHLKLNPYLFCRQSLCAKPGQVQEHLQCSYVMQLVDSDIYFYLFCDIVNQIFKSLSATAK